LEDAAQLWIVQNGVRRRVDDPAVDVDLASDAGVGNLDTARDHAPLVVDREPAFEQQPDDPLLGRTALELLHNLLEHARSDDWHGFRGSGPNDQRFRSRSATNPDRVLIPV